MVGKKKKKVPERVSIGQVNHPRDLKIRNKIKENQKCVFRIRKEVSSEQNLISEY